MIKIIKTKTNISLLKKKERRMKRNQIKFTSISKIQKRRNKRRKKNKRDREKYKLQAKPA